MKETNQETTSAKAAPAPAAKSEEDIRWVETGNLLAKKDDVGGCQVAWYRGMPCALIFQRSVESKAAIVVETYGCVVGETSSAMRDDLRTNGKPAKDLALPVKTTMAKQERAMKSYFESGMKGERPLNTREALIQDMSVALAPVVQNVMSAMAAQEARRNQAANDAAGLKG